MSEGPGDVSDGPANAQSGRHSAPQSSSQSSSQSGAAPTTVRPDAAPPPEPSLSALFAANLRVFGALLVLAGGAFGLWRLAAWLFSDVSWLQLGD